MTDPYERNRLLAKSIPAVKKKQPMWCWAASMEWWGRATRRADMDQELIFDTHKGVVENNGGILQRNLKAVMELGPWWADVAIFEAGEELVCTDGSETSCARVQAHQRPVAAEANNWPGSFRVLSRGPHQRLDALDCGDSSTVEVNAIKLVPTN